MRKTARQITTRDLLIAIAIIGLMLAHLTHLYRTRPTRTRVTIRVLNNTSEDIGFLRYEWKTVAAHLESSGENSGRFEIAPGGLKTFRVDLPGPVDFTLDCTTPESRMTSGPVRIDVGGGHPTSLDFDVRPRGVMLRWTTRSGKSQPKERDGTGGIGPES
jgi:hypothetical protein